ncbi:MAG: SMC-Scp complex subunit ScpB [bacterium]|nr:MAG: SMC-Scp complex subunit ScpB [bacterium]
MLEKKDDRAEKHIERTIEALLFASDIPLSRGKLVSLADAPSVRAVQTAIGSLKEFYKEHRRSFCIVEVAGGYQLTTLPEFSGAVSRLFKSKRKSRLSQPALETLAIVAYKQPISRMEIEALRGVNCEGVLSTLTDRDLITISGRGEGVGRPYLYATTKTFLEYLGLKDFKDLPSLEEIERSLEEVNRPVAVPADVTERPAHDEELSQTEPHPD